MLRHGRAGKALITSLAASTLVVAAALALGGGLVPSILAQQGTQNCCPTFCQLHPGAPQCTPPTLPNMSQAEKLLFKGSLQLTMGFWPPRQGLGPVFTQSACIDCHGTPFAGGSGSVQVTHFGKMNSDGTFNPLTSEGGDQLHPQSIQGIFQAPNCKLPGEVIPSDATVITQRQTPPTLGNGLMDSIPDATILQNVTNQQNSQFDQSLGIHGQANMVPDLSGNLRPGRFGWKAHMPTLLQFVAGAFQGELGITNPIHPTEHLPQGQPIPAGCQVAASEPNDSTGNETVHINQFELFIAPHTAATLDQHGQNGLALFQSIGCAECHVPSMQTAATVYIPLSLTSSGQIASTSSPHNSPSLTNQTAKLYSDLLIHDMGPGLDGTIPLGQATGTQWRTTPLWGLSLKQVYLHDGRTADLTTAILAHAGEGAKVIQNFQGLTAQQQQDLLTFLNAL